MTRSLILGALAVLVLVAAPLGARADSRRTVAVLPVVVHASGEQAYLQSGVSDMLASRLGQAPGVAIIRVNDPATATTDTASAQAAARAVGADFVLFGSFTRFGEGASLDVRCAEVNEDPEKAARSVFIQSGSISELIPQLDGLADKVGRYVAEGSAALPAVASAATPLPDAGPGEDAAFRSELELLRERVGRLEAELRILQDASDE